MTRLLLALRYLGTRYHGWQVQPNAPTIQETVQDAVESITGVRSGVTGCSRTDAGVHAEMYCCAFDTESRLRGREMVKALNARLPRDIAVYGCREVPETFHPRYAASGKRYVYRFWNAPERNPFWEERACQVRRPLEVERMDAAARDFLGTHDFVSCRASDPHRSGPGAEDTVRTVTAAHVRRHPEEPQLVEFTVEADGFLYNMVRIMAGTLLDMAAGKLPWDAVPAALSARDRQRMGATAPAKGLSLTMVRYPREPFFLNGEEKPTDYWPKQAEF